MENYAAAMSSILSVLLLDEDCGSIDGVPISCQDPAGMDSGMPGWFGAVFVLMLVIGVGGAIYRMSAARSMATKAGLDPDDAANVALLDEHGVAAAYVMSNLQKRDEPAPSSDAGERTVEQRLAELQSLLDRGLVTQAEYDEQRAEILDSI